MLPTKFGVNMPFGSGEEAKKYIFKMAAMAAILCFRLEWFLLFWSTRHRMLPITFQENRNFVSGEEAKNRFSKMAAILDFPSK